MKRSPMGPRKKRIRAYNAERAKKRRDREFGSKAQWIRQMSCCVCGARAPSAPHHVRSRGAGGTAKDLIPVCHAHHREIHTQGRQTFESDHVIDLTFQAERYEAWWQEGERTGLHRLGF